MTESEALVIEPDVGFVNKLIGNGGETLKKCFQCGNCSVVCNISPEREPFPRKEMIWAQWGQRDKLIGNADIWLCHQCNDCSTHCPRGANPGDVMAAVRTAAIEEAAPFGLGRLFSGASTLPILVAIPAILIGIVIAIASKSGFMTMEPIVFSNMMPVPAIDVVFLPTVFFAAFCALLGVRKMWSSFKENTPGVSKLDGSLISSIIAVTIGIMKHEKMGECDVNGARTNYHRVLFYGFLGLVATTTFVAIFYWLNKLDIVVVSATPLALSHPVKILGNVSALLALIGAAVIVKRRFTEDEKVAGVLGWYDRFFMLVLFETIATGILAEIFRLMGISWLAFGIYYIHLVLVFMLLVYAPFSKFAHMFYRFTALTFAHMAKREAPNALEVKQ